MSYPQYEFIVVSEHNTGIAFFLYLCLFDNLSLLRFVDHLPSNMENIAKYNGIWFKDILPITRYCKIVEIINAQKKVNLCILTRDPLLQMVSAFNVWMFSVVLPFFGLPTLSPRGRSIYESLLKSSSRRDFFRNWMLVPNDFYFKNFLFDYMVLPFFKNKINEVYIIDTLDVMPENVYSTMDYFKHNFFNSEIDYSRVDVNASLMSVYTGWMFWHLSAFKYASSGLNFSLRPWPLQLNWLQRVPENTYISYEPEEVEWSCGKFDGRIAFNLVPDKSMTPQTISELMPRIRNICEADDKRLLREYCRHTSFMVNMAYKFYDTLKTSKDEVLEILKGEKYLLDIIKNKIYAKAAAYNELGYDVTKHWTVAAELFEGGNILPEEHKYDHLYAVIDELKEQLLRQGEDLEKLTKAMPEQEKRDAALKQKHQVSSLSKKQKFLFRLITPIVKKFASETQFKRFRETPALFFKSLKKRKYRIFGELFFPARRGLF